MRLGSTLHCGLALAACDGSGSPPRPSIEPGLLCEIDIVPVPEEPGLPSVDGLDGSWTLQPPDVSRRPLSPGIVNATNRALSAYLDAPAYVDEEFFGLGLQGRLDEPDLEYRVSFVALWSFEGGPLGEMVGSYRGAGRRHDGSGRPRR